ncbi:MAG: MarR family winged helix-turn-helix transcriptional regulator [Candidatus Saccharibacteria bacterium]
MPATPSITAKLAALSDRFATCMLRRQHREHESLSILSLRTLALIYFNEQPPTMKELAHMLGIKLPSASVIVDKLVQDSYVERSHDDRDKRIIRLQLTDKARKLLRAHRERSDAIIHGAIQQLTVDEQQAVLRFLEACIAIAEQQNQNSKSGSDSRS